MDLEKIEGLVKIIENSSLTEFTLKEGDMKITMSKLDHPPVVAAGMPVAAAPAAPEVAVEEENPEDEKLFITSPIVGTFYSAPAPDAPTFVKAVSYTHLFRSRPSSRRLVGIFMERKKSSMASMPASAVFSKST